MPIADQTNVRILVDGQPLAEYQDPEAAPEAHREKNRYVEVKTGQQFFIQIQLLPGFRLQWAGYIYYSRYIDQDLYYWYSYVPTTSLKHRKGVLPKTFSNNFTSIRLRNDQTGAWEWCRPIFGALGIAENDRIDGDTSKITPDDVRTIGSIRLALYRATVIELDTPEYDDGERTFIPDELPKKLLKGLNFKNNVKFPSGTPCGAPAPITHDFIPLPQLSGEMYTFNIFYRSRNCLQNLGCIPRSPSPPTDPTLMLERTEDMLKLSKQRERESNMRILRLQEQLKRASTDSRNNSVKSENLDGGTLIEGRSRSAILDLTGTDIKEEPDVQTIDNLVASDSTERSRPEPLLFSATTNNKRPREEEADANEAVAKRARLEAETQMPPMEGHAGGKRKRVEEAANQDDLVELPPTPKRARVVEVVDLTDG